MINKCNSLQIYLDDFCKLACFVHFLRIIPYSNFYLCMSLILCNENSCNSHSRMGKYSQIAYEQGERCIFNQQEMRHFISRSCFIDAIQQLYLLYVYAVSFMTDDPSLQCNMNNPSNLTIRAIISAKRFVLYSKIYYSQVLLIDLKNIEI